VKSDPLEPGLQIGDLTLVELTGGKHPTSSSPIWQCECECGRPALRTATRLRQCLRDSVRPACHRCLAELRRGRHLDYLAERAIAYAEAFEVHGDLYSRNHVEFETEKLIADVEAEGVPVAEDPDDFRGTPSLDELAVWEPPKLAHPGPAWSDLYPMRIARAAPCDLCNRKARVGWGCVQCLGWMCPACLRAGRHCGCSPNALATYEQIGKDLDEPVSRERVRQILEKALRKIRAAVDPERTGTFDETEENLRYSAVRDLYLLLKLEPPWVKEVVDQLGWQKVAAFTTQVSSQDEKSRTRVLFTLQIAEDGARAAAFIERFIEEKHVQAEEAAKRKKREESDRRRREIREAAEAADRRQREAEQQRRNAEALNRRVRNEELAAQRALAKGKPRVLVLGPKRFQIALTRRIAWCVVHVTTPHPVDLMLLNESEVREMNRTGYGRNRGIENRAGELRYAFSAPWSDYWCIVVGNPGDAPITASVRVTELRIDNTKAYGGLGQWVTR
jgi:hypothetical protein